MWYISTTVRYADKSRHRKTGGIFICIDNQPAAIRRTFWIIIMTNKKTVGITVPETVKFSDLKLTRDAVTRNISFEWGPINAICAASGIDPAIFLNEGADNVAELINVWYAMHRNAGGSPDPVQEELIKETLIAVHPVPTQVQ